MTNSLLDGGGKSTWLSSKKLEDSGQDFTGTVTSITERPYVPYGQTEPEVFKSGDVRRELLVGVDVNGENHVLPVKESTDLHKKLKSAATRAEVKLGEIPGLTITVKHIGRTGTGHTAAHLHEVELS